MNMNNSTQSTNGTSTTPTIFPRSLIIPYSIGLVWSLVGNVLVIAVVYCNQNLRTNINYLIVNMAVSDLLIPLITMPWLISQQLVRPTEWLVEGLFGDALCKLVVYFSNVSPYVSSISLVFIAFQRFIAVVYPTRTQIFSRKTRWVSISVSWFVAMALVTPYFYARRLTHERGYTACGPSWRPAQVIWISVQTVVGFVIPLIVIIILYAIIVYELRQSLKNVIDALEKEAIRLRQIRNKRIFKMSVTIVTMFTICWCPLFVLLLLYFSQFPSSESNINLQLYFILRLMWYLLAAINPCIYFVFLKDFRQGLKRICCRNTALEPISIPAPRSRMNINTNCTRTRPGGDSNQGPTCTPPHHINTTSV